MEEPQEDALPDILDELLDYATREAHKTLAFVGEMHRDNPRPEVLVLYRMLADQYTVILSALE